MIKVTFTTLNGVNCEAVTDKSNVILSCCEEHCGDVRRKIRIKGVLFLGYEANEINALDYSRIEKQLLVS